MQLIDLNLLDKITTEASENIRLRKNFNLHASLNDNVQQLLNALEPGTKLPIHRHINTTETYLLIRGSMNVLIYNDNKEIIDLIELNPSKGNYGISIDKNTWHTIDVLEKGTIIFEVKEGPYTPISSVDIL